MFTAQVNKNDSLAALLADLNARGASDVQKYSAVKQFLNFKARKKGVPISGSFELTPLCNLDCKMCYVHLNKEQLNGAELLSVDQWKHIMQEAINTGMMYARLTGGECLTYSGFKELYLFLLEKGVEVSLLSNGLLMNDEMVSFLKDHKPAEIQVTLYGSNDDAYEAVTGSRVFRQVAKNIKKIDNAEIAIKIAVTPSEYMKDGIEIIKYLHSEGLHYAINPGLISPREETGRKLSQVDLSSYINMLKLQRELNGKDVDNTIDPESLPDPGSKEIEPIQGVRCGAGRSCFSIDWKGNMRPCNTFPCDPVSVLDIGFVEAWKITNHTANNYPLPQECEGCTYKSICKHCVAEHASGAPCGHANPSICEWAKAMVSEGLLTLQPVEI